MSPTGRYLLRATIVGLLALISSLIASTVGSDLTLNEVFVAIGEGVAALGAYAGIGVSSKNVEPHIGKQG